MEARAGGACRSVTRRLRWLVVAVGAALHVGVVVRRSADDELRRKRQRLLRRFLGFITDAHLFQMRRIVRADKGKRIG